MTPASPSRQAVIGSAKTSPRQVVGTELGQVVARLLQVVRFFTFFFKLCVFYTRDYSKQILLLHKNAKIGKICVNLALFSDRKRLSSGCRLSALVRVY